MYESTLDIQPEFENKHCKELEEGFREYLHYANLVQNISTEREEVHHHSENHFELMEGINEVENVPFEEIFENEAILNENQGNIQVVNNLDLEQNWDVLNGNEGNEEIHQVGEFFDDYLQFIQR